MHNHSSEFVEKITLNQGFSFHPKLADWIVSGLSLSGEELVTVFEAGCNESSCPVEETLFVIEKSDLTVSRLKLGRRKDQISKNDFYFALQKQLNGKG